MRERGSKFPFERERKRILFKIKEIVPRPGLFGRQQSLSRKNIEITTLLTHFLCNSMTKENLYSIYRWTIL